MRGIEGAREYFRLYGKKIKEQFPDVIKYLAFGICGQGSECLGFDDEISRDHDFEPGFCIFLPDEDVVGRKTAFELERAYSNLPKEFDGAKRSLVAPVGGSRRGVIRISEFFEARVGEGDGRLSNRQWLSIPEFYLLEATNGEIFEDNYGLMTEIRKRLGRFPEDIRLKKLASNLLLCGQSGRYNFQRCISHGETGGAQLAVFEFVNAAMKTVFLLNRKYCPFYKWSFRALKGLDKLSQLSDSFEFLITSDNDQKTAALKAEIIEDICRMITSELRAQKLIGGEEDPEIQAYAVNSSISDPEIRNMNILAGV